MDTLAGYGPPPLRRLDHLICEVPDIEAAMRLFVDRLGFPEAWPVGRFWPQGLTSGVAIGGINLEFLQLDEGAPDAARIRTLVLEPLGIGIASSYYSGIGFPMELREKWESDPDLLRLRGFSEEETRIPQMICRNLIPLAAAPIDFFLCEYVPMLRRKLGPEAFLEVPRLREVIIATPSSEFDGKTLDDLFPALEGVPVTLSDTDRSPGEIVAIRTDRGPLDLGEWSATFRFI